MIVLGVHGVKDIVVYPAEMGLCPDPELVYAQKKIMFPIVKD